MGKLIELKFSEKHQRERLKDPNRDELLRLIEISDQLDQVILHHLNSGKVTPKEIAGILAHRLGNLLKQIDDKDNLWPICEKVAKGQADIA